MISAISQLYVNIIIHRERTWGLVEKCVFTWVGYGALCTSPAHISSHTQKDDIEMHSGQAANAATAVICLQSSDLAPQYRILLRGLEH